MLTGILARLFGRGFNDILSGYRVFSRRFVKSFPVLFRGFGSETEIGVHTLELKMPVAGKIAEYSAGLSTGLMLPASLSLFVGMVPDIVARGRRELRRLSCPGFCTRIAFQRSSSLEARSTSRNGGLADFRKDLK